MNNTIPKYILKYWIKEIKNSGPPKLRHLIFYDEEDMVKELPKIKGNYFIFNVGQPYKSKEYFDKMFAEQQLDKEKQEYLKLKAKFDGKTD